MQTDNCIVDLFSVRPQYSNISGSHAHFPFRLLQQRWLVNGGLSIDCGYSKAIALSPDIKTISMRSLFLQNLKISESDESSASMFFMKKLKDYIKAENLTCLIPDWINDFDLETIRKSINFHFEKSIPLPKSIAAVFAWQSSKKFVKDNICKKDIVLIVDSFDEGISITPVLPIYQRQKELNAILPEMQGITWERHPTFIVPKKEIYSVMACNLDNDGCQASKDIIRLFGFDGLIADAGKVSFVKDDSCYHLPDSVRKTLNQNLDINISDAIDRCLKSMNRDCRGATIFILPLEDTIKKPDMPKNYNWLGSAWSIINGCQTLNKWQGKVPDIALWSDHLPDLSIKILHDGLYENFYLVKDATIISQRGKTVDIPVKGEFTLPAGQKHYSFPLLQGEGNKELRFVVYLKSPAFPLKEGTKCRLEMKYTYGEDNPYQLNFIPLKPKEAGFKSIVAEWRSASASALESETIDLKNLPVPKFPARKSWSDFQNFPPKEGRNEPTDLLNWCCSSLAVLDKQSSFNMDVVRKRIFNIHFPVLTIWNHDHSLNEPEAPDYFRNIIFQRTQEIPKIIESENTPKTLQKELLFFLSCLHRDAPTIVGDRLLDAVKDKKLLMDYYRHIAFAIGSAELPWQKDLLDNVINPIGNDSRTISFAMQILSIAFWRSEGLINKLTKDEFEVINLNLYKRLESEHQKVMRYGNSYPIETLCNHLELLLALIRSRENEDEVFKMIFAPNSDLTQKYVNLIDDISKIVIDRKIKLKSRISLQIEKPESLQRTPDLLYALRMYLTCDSGAGAISISGISDE